MERAPFRRAGHARLIEVRNGVFWVPNPVNDKENFADKWAEHPERRHKFTAWLAQAEKDFAEPLGKRGLAEVADVLSREPRTPSGQQGLRDHGLGHPPGARRPAISEWQRAPES